MASATELSEQTCWQMPSTLDRDVAHLVEIQEAIKRVRAYVTGFDRSAFLADAKTCDATAMQLVVIGESARSLTDAARNIAPEIPWSNVIGLRNRIVHGYKTLDHANIWRIVTTELDTLDVVVSKVLATKGA